MRPVAVGVGAYLGRTRAAEQLGLPGNTSHMNSVVTRLQFDGVAIEEAGRSGSAHHSHINFRRTFGFNVGRHSDLPVARCWQGHSQL